MSTYNDFNLWKKEKAGELFKRDAEITHYYNNVMANGKWAHMMDQTHIGYTYWQQPDSNAMPAIQTIALPTAAEMGVAIEGATQWWPNEKNEAVLPAFDPYHQQVYYLEIFNRGQMPFEYSAQVEAPWIKIDKAKGKVGIEERFGIRRVPITVTGPNNSRVVVRAIINNPVSPKRDAITGFVESNGYVSIEAEHYTRTVDSSPVKWQRIPDLGRTLSAMTPVPVTSPPQTPEGNGARLEYQIHFFSKGEVKVKACLSPTLNFHNAQGLRYAISFDDEPPQIVNMHAGKTFQEWEESLRNNITVATSKHMLNAAGKRVLKFWMVAPGVVLQKLVIETGEVKPSYLGPPESYRR